MLGKTDPQASFFDSYVEEYFLPKKHELLKIKKELDFSFIEEETKDLYAKAAGRPSYPPEVTFKILFLEFYYNLSDVEVVKQLRFNVLLRYFVEIKIEDPLPDDTSLVVFRKRLGEERFERIFDKFVKQCKEKGLLKEKFKIVDATHIIADVAISNTVELLREGRERILKAIKKALGKRKRIEAKFGEAKKHYQMARAKYRGRWRVAIQVFMTFIVMNLKRVVKLLKPKKAVAKLGFSSG